VLRYVKKTYVFTNSGDVEFDCSHRLLGICLFSEIVAVDFGQLGREFTKSQFRKLLTAINGEAADL
jgi:hypothetical protein